MTDPFETALAFIWRPDNDGQSFHMTANDPGGATSWGVTFSTWASWERLHGRQPALAVFRTLGMADFRPLYRAWFWNACRCASLPPGVDLTVFDAAVGSAPAHAARFLQSVVGADQDGEIGPLTCAAAARMPAADVINKLVATREAFYAALPTFRYFGRGWDRRAEDCRALALSMAAPNNTEPARIAGTPTGNPT